MRYYFESVFRLKIIEISNEFKISNLRSFFYGEIVFIPSSE